MNIYGVNKMRHELCCRTGRIICDTGPKSKCNCGNGTDKNGITREHFLRSCSLEEMAETIADIAYAAMRHNSPALCDREYVTEWLKGEYDGK